MKVDRKLKLKMQKDLKKLLKNKTLISNTQQIIDAWQAKNVEFYTKLLTELLGREPDLEKDKGRFVKARHESYPQGCYRAMFDGNFVGEIVEIFEPNNMSITFYPVETKIEKA